MYQYEKGIHANNFETRNLIKQCCSKFASIDIFFTFLPCCVFTEFDSNESVNKSIFTLDIGKSTQFIFQKVYALISILSSPLFFNSE